MNIEEAIKDFRKIFCIKKASGYYVWNGIPDGQEIEDFLESKLQKQEAEWRNTLRQIAEIYIGMEGFKPQTAPEAYQQHVLKDMYDEIQKALNNPDHTKRIEENFGDVLAKLD